jgi:hypothetical protein
LAKNKPNKSTGGLDSCIVVVVSDLHVGSTIGLCPPHVQMDDGGSYTPSLPQKWLWAKWLQVWDHYAQMKKQLELPLVAIINGDIPEGDHHATHQIVSKNKNDQILVAAKVLEPLLQVADYHIIMRGTPAHVGRGAWIEELIARDTDAIPCSEKQYSWWHLSAVFGGVLFDVKHHPESGSGRPWTKGADANRIAAQIVYEYATDGAKIPQIGLRSHRHGFRDSGYNHPCRVFITPAWQFDTEFVHRIGVGGGINPKGALHFICRNGEYEFGRLMFKPERKPALRLGIDG